MYRIANSYQNGNQRGVLPQNGPFGLCINFRHRTAGLYRWESRYVPVFGGFLDKVRYHHHYIYGETYSDVWRFPCRQEFGGRLRWRISPCVLSWRRDHIEVIAEQQKASPHKD